jgi:hypothetical protein
MTEVTLGPSMSTVRDFRGFGSGETRRSVSDCLAMTASARFSGRLSPVEEHVLAVLAEMQRHRVRDGDSKYWLTLRRQIIARALSEEKAARWLVWLRATQPLKPPRPPKRVRIDATLKTNWRDNSEYDGTAEGGVLAEDLGLLACAGCGAEWYDDATLCEICGAPFSFDAE